MPINIELNCPQVTSLRAYKNEQVTGLLITKQTELWSRFETAVPENK